MLSVYVMMPLPFVCTVGVSYNATDKTLPSAQTAKSLLQVRFFTAFQIIVVIVAVLSKCEDISMASPVLDLKRMVTH